MNKKFQTFVKHVNWQIMRLKWDVLEIKEGKTELEIVAAIEYELKKKGITDMSFATMVLNRDKRCISTWNSRANKIQERRLRSF